jgi:hypothetical protein
MANVRTSKLSMVRKLKNQGQMRTNKKISIKNPQEILCQKEIQMMNQTTQKAAKTESVPLNPVRMVFALNSQLSMA